MPIETGADMDVLILCAGAADKSCPGPKKARPLRTRGKRQAQKIGAFLAQSSLRPERVLTAEDERSRATASKAFKAAGWTARGVEISPDLSKGALPEMRAGGPVLLVAAPRTWRDLSDICTIARQVEATGGFKAGMLVRAHLTPSGGRLVERVDPKDLPDGFPYPAPDGPERRPRPAYYYTQSAVIPFRRSGQGLEVLMVRSSSGRHWTLPKGIVEPGLSPAASARVEAREEAGVEGKVTDAPLGSYSYAKWGATCDVTVFGMEVTDVLPEAVREERHRRRIWVSPTEAALMIHQPAIRPLLLGL